MCMAAIFCYPERRRRISIRPKDKILRSAQNDSIDGCQNDSIEYIQNDSVERCQNYRSLIDASAPMAAAGRRYTDN